MNASELFKYLLTPSAQVAVIIGLAELVKRTGCPSKWIPLLDIVLGLVSGVCVYGVVLGHGILNGILIGLAIGMSACGLFSGIKNTLGIQHSDGGDSEDLS